jgi:ribosomal protein S18 acetylase RimI-like enzyme
VRARKGYTLKSTFLVRTALVGESSQIADFFLRNVTTYVDRDTPYHAYIESLILKPTKVSVIAVTVESNHRDMMKVIGYLSVDLIERPRGGVIAYLGEVLVDNKHRRLGVASDMIKFGIDQASRKGCHRLILNSTNEKLDLYKRLGFEEWEMALKINL